MIVLLSTPLYYQSLTESGLTDLFVLSIITNHKCIRNFSIFTSRMCWCRVLEIICWRVDVSDIRTLEMQMVDVGVVGVTCFSLKQLRSEGRSQQSATGGQEESSFLRLFQPSILRIVSASSLQQLSINFNISFKGR